MTLVLETEALRARLKGWADDPEWALLVRYELLPQKPSPVWHLRLSHNVGRALRVLGLSRSRYLKQSWHAGLKHAQNPPQATPLLIWSEGHDRRFVRDACEGMKSLLGDHSEFLPVLVTDVADFAFYSRLGWLVEYLPELNGSGPSYRDRKRRYLAWRYRDALAVPLSAGLVSRREFENVLGIETKGGGVPTIDAACEMIPFERLVDSVHASADTARADRILAHGWPIRRDETLDLRGEIPWLLKSHDQRTYNYRLQCWAMIDPLLRAHSSSLNQKYLDFCLPVVLSWIDQHSDPATAGISPFAWYDMSVGLRAYRLAYLFDAAERNGILNADSRRKLWGALEQHAAYLADDANIAFHSNHGFYQVAGQIAMGRRFAAASPTMAQALGQGRERLKGMVEQQFAQDGVHREHSPDYHYHVYTSLQALLQAGLLEHLEPNGYFQKIEEALSWFVLPNQHIVNFGDTDDRSFACKPEEAERVWLTPQMRFWASGGKVGTPSPGIMRVFQDGGYWVVRAPGDDPHQLMSHSYLALNAAFHSRTHKHADDLSFVWFERGCNILVDAGRYGYIGKTEQDSDLWRDGHWYSDPWRVYCESTRAHNTLEFDGRNFPRKGAAPYGSALRRWGADEAGLYFVEAGCRHFGSVRHDRMIFFKPRQWVVVVDWFCDESDEQHAVRQWFHLGHGLPLVAEQGQYQVTMPGGRDVLRISSLISGPVPSRPYLGEEEPTVQGWWSPRERHIVPSHAFCHELRDSSTGAFATVFAFSGQLQPDREWSGVEVSGRRGRFRWRDERTTHELRFDRPAEGDVSVKYGAFPR